MASNARLKLVEDFSHDAAHFIGEQSGMITSNSAEIGAKLSLYFLWPEQSSAVICLPQDPKIRLECRIDYDRDEREPSELYLHLIGPNPIANPELVKRLIVRFETFRNCYEFEADTLNFTADENGAALFVVPPPEALRTYKLRGLPRQTVNHDQRPSIPACTWQAGGQSPVHIREVQELGLASVVTSKMATSGESTGYLCFGDLKIPSRIVRQTETQTIFHLRIEDDATFGSYFEIYRKVAYPGIVPRHEIRQAQALELYSSTGYFSEFTSEPHASSESGAPSEQILSAWKAVDSCQHRHSADYVFAAPDGNLTGASSATKAFETESGTFWAFHQLCGIALPSLLEASGTLYTWRAEYLAARPEQLRVLGWFRSKSRWLERIYVKFVQMTSAKSKLLAIQLVCGDQQASSPALQNVDGSARLRFGPLERISAWSQKNNFVFAVNPSFLNASQSLDHILPLSILENDSGDFQIPGLQDVIAATGASTIYVTQAPGSPVPPGFRTAASDRFFLIQKSDLCDFISSVEHSVALTRRKYNQ